MAGQVVSLDSWKECLAVGSEIVQIFRLSNLQERPERTIYATKGDLMPVILYNHTRIVPL